MPQLSLPPAPKPDLATRLAALLRHRLGAGQPASDRAQADAPGRGVVGVAAPELAALRLRVAQAEGALELAGLGRFSWAPGTGTLHGSARMRHIFGFAPGQGCTWAEVIDRCAAQDRAGLRSALSACEGTGEGLQLRWCVEHADGTLRHVHCQAMAMPMPTEGGTASVFVGTVRDITPEVEAERVVRLVEERKDDFLGLLAHELRNPLAPIVIAAEILRRPGISAAQVRSMGELVQRQASHITALVADLMDMARIGKGLMTITRTVLDLRKVLDDAVEQVRPLMAQRSQQFTLRAPATALPVDGDANRLVQVFANILNNAAKYTPPCGAITLDAQVLDGQVVARVRDSGMGMDRELLPHVFENFTQAQRSPDRALGGLGLGLSLVRNLVALHGGHVTADSQGRGRGSEITVCLPLAGQAAPADRRRSGARAEAGGRARHVVVVDSNHDAARTLATLLEMEGHTVSVRASALDVSAGAATEHADVYILQASTSAPHGPGLGHRIREASVPPGPLLISLSNSPGGQDRAHSLAAGFDHHFDRPLDPARLLDLVARAPLLG